MSAGACGQAAAARGEWALPLFRRSVLKQAKLDQITRLLDAPAGRECLDIGADNGVISLLLRRLGGRWSSADLDERAVASIRELVGERVYRLDGARTPFPDRSFDQVVVVDYLEHVADDAAFVRELARIVRPGGSVIINVPHLKPASRLNRLRHAIGLTDAWHGHLRPGYRLEQLRALLGLRLRDRAGRQRTPAPFPSWWIPCSTACICCCSIGKHRAPSPPKERW